MFEAIKKPKIIDIVETELGLIQYSRVLELIKNHKRTLIKLSIPNPIDYSEKVFRIANIRISYEGVYGLGLALTDSNGIQIDLDFKRKSEDYLTLRSMNIKNSALDNIVPISFVLEKIKTMRR